MTSAGPAHVELRHPEGSPRFLLALTHGAGGTPDTPDVLAVSAAARALGAVTALVTQPYRVRGGRAPGSAVRQDAAWTEIIAALREIVHVGRAAGSGDNAGSGELVPPCESGSGLPVIQGGRSNGARVACRTAGQVGAVGVVALAFPLHPPGQPEKSREAELRGAGARVLVINGDRDPFGVPEPDETTDVVILPGETHTLSKHPAAVGDAVSAWLGVLPGLALSLP